MARVKPRAIPANQGGPPVEPAQNRAILPDWSWTIGGLGDTLLRMGMVPPAGAAGPE